MTYGRHLVTGGSDGRLSVWNFSTGQLIKTFELTKEEIRGVLIIGRLLITASMANYLFRFKWYNTYMVRNMSIY